MSARDKFVHLAIEQIGKTALMGAKGPSVFDCSGLVTWCLRQAGGPDLTQTHNAQKLHDRTRPLTADDLPIPGDLCFYGGDGRSVEHVAIALAGGLVLSADGATHRITDLTAARAAHAAVRVHTTILYRLDCPYVTTHRNTFVDTLDLVTL